MPVENGVATLDAGILPTGHHEFTAVYAGGVTSAGSRSTAAAPTGGPKVIGPSRHGFHASPTSLVLTFDLPLDADRAQDVANYRIVGARGHRLGVSLAAYDPETRSVTLLMRERLNVHRSYTLTVNGSGPGGVAGITGLPLNGSGQDRPGTDFSTRVSWRALTRPGRPQAVMFVSSRPVSSGGGFRATIGSLLGTGRGLRARPFGASAPGGSSLPRFGGRDVR